MTLQDWAHLATIIAPLVALSGVFWALRRSVEELAQVRVQLELGQAQLKIASKQLELGHAQLRDEHTYRRRSATIDVCARYDDTVGWELGIARRIIQTLDEKQCKKVRKFEQIEVDAKTCGPLVLSLFKFDNLYGAEYQKRDTKEWISLWSADKETLDEVAAGPVGIIRLGIIHVAAIRAHGVAYENLLEGIFHAARLEVAVADEVLNEFETFMTDPEHALSKWWLLDGPHCNISWALDVYKSRRAKMKETPTGLKPAD